jgi:hypothetical protein
VVPQESFGVSEDLQRDLVEAIAWWQVHLPDASEILTHAATELLAAGDDRPSVVELASAYADANWSSLDALVDRVIDDLVCRDALVRGAEIIATRRLCRLVLSGEVPPRSLTQTLHSSIGYFTEWKVIYDMIALDDSYDAVEWSAFNVDDVDGEVRRLAQLIVDTSDDSLAALDDAELRTDLPSPFRGVPQKRRRRINPWVALLRRAKR